MNNGKQSRQRHICKFLIAIGLVLRFINSFYHHIFR